MRAQSAARHCSAWQKQKRAKKRVKLTIGLRSLMHCAGRRAMQCGENLTKLLYYFNISSPLEVVWSHATNSKVKLERALAPGRYSEY